MRATSEGPALIWVPPRRGLAHSGGGPELTGPQGPGFLSGERWSQLLPDMAEEREEQAFSFPSEC